MLAKLEGRVAVVTGGNQGIGRAIALKLAESGADVVINARNPELAGQVMSQIKARGRRALFEPGDIMDYDSVKRMVDRAIARMGKVDIMVANGGAGEPPPRFFHDIDPSEYGAYLQTRQFSRLYCVRAVLDHMRERGYGKIVIITSDAGRVPTPRESLIGSAAAGLVLLTKALAREFLRWHIRINTICTTVTRDTPGYEKAMSSEARHLFQKATERMPFGLNSPDDLAEAALFLASPESDQITGQVLSINGGLSFPG